MSITAAEAKKIATSADNAKTQTELKSVYEKVKKAANSGSLSVYLSGSLSSTTQRILKEQGYKYSEYYDQRDRESSITLSWS